LTERVGSCVVLQRVYTNGWKYMQYICVTAEVHSRVVMPNQQ